MSHASELIHVFGNYDGGLVRAANRRVTATIQQYWTNLAKYGDPNGPPGRAKASVVWPRYNASADRHVRLADPPAVGQFYGMKDCDFWDTLG